MNALTITLIVVAALSALLAVVWIRLVARFKRRYPELQWDWSQIDTSDVSFPEDFVFGVAAAAHQVEGGNENNNWSWWEKQTDKKGRPKIKDGHVAGRACDHWNRYAEDIQLIKEVGATSYRMSVEWSRIEPRQGEWDQEALDHYSKVIDECIRQGIEPMVTLQHFTHPLWFHEMGAFEKEENIAIFIRFCERVFQEFSDRVTMWCTINEPEVVPMMGYLLGIFPPGKHSLRRTAEVMRNMVLAHARVVQALEKLPNGERAQIGLVKNVFQFEPYHRWSLPEWLLARLASRVYNDAILDYLRTGTFSMKVPFLCWYEKHDPEVKGSGDFFGLNYYSHMNVVIQPSIKAPIFWRPRPGEVVTDMPYASYAEGFYRALREVAAFGKPVYVTENGLADDRDDRRDEFIRRYLYALSEALSEGLDIRGYYYWSLMDNFEWAEGWTMKFGLYEMDLETLERRLREGSRPFVETARSVRDARESKHLAS